MIIKLSEEGMSKLERSWKFRPLYQLPRLGMWNSLTVGMEEILMVKIKDQTSHNIPFSQSLTYSSTLAWKIPWMEEPGRLQSMGSQSQKWLSDFIFFLSIVPFEEANGNPLQCSCLENPMDGRAWWATVYGVAKNRTRLSN